MTAIGTKAKSDSVPSSIPRHCISLISAFFRCRQSGHASLQKILSNVVWLFADKILRMAVGLLVGIWVARYLGPEQFGLLSFAVAYVALFSPISALGLRDTAVRNLVKGTSTAAETLGTSFVLRFISGLIASFLAVCTVSELRPDDTVTKSIVAIIAFTLATKAADVVEYWFDSQVQSKYALWARNGAFLVIACVKVVMIAYGASLTAFAWIILAEAVATAGALLAVYSWTTTRLLDWKPRLHVAKHLLQDSWPLILSGIAVTVYMRTDQVMLGHMMGHHAVGVYTAAVRISEVWYFLPIAIAASSFPSIVEASARTDGTYHQRLQHLYDVVALAALLTAVPTAFFSKPLTMLLFGHAYADAASILSIYIWASIFAALGAVNGKHLVVQGLTRVALFFTVSAALANVLMNLILIPRFGAAGAAYATLGSFVVGTFLNVIPVRTRPAFYMQARALCGWSIFKKLSRRS